MPTLDRTRPPSSLAAIGFRGGVDQEQGCYQRERGDILTKEHLNHVLTTDQGHSPGDVSFDDLQRCPPVLLLSATSWSDGSFDGSLSATRLYRQGGSPSRLSRTAGFERQQRR
jgi:hypothetical protein